MEVALDGRVLVRPVIAGSIKSILVGVVRPVVILWIGIWLQMSWVGISVEVLIILRNFIASISSIDMVFPNIPCFRVIEAKYLNTTIKRLAVISIMGWAVLIVSVVVVLWHKRHALNIRPVILVPIRIIMVVRLLIIAFIWYSSIVTLIWILVLVWILVWVLVWVLVLVLVLWVVLRLTTIGVVGLPVGVPIIRIH